MHTNTKLLTFFLVICSLPLFSQLNPSDSLLTIRASKADSLARLYKNRNYRFDSALFYGKRAITWRRKLSDQIALAKSLTGLGDVYYTRKKYKEAALAFQESARIAHRLRHFTLEKAAYDKLIQNAKRADNYKQAFYYQGLISALDDSILNAINEEKSKEIIALKKQLEEEKTLAENKVLKQRQEINNLQSTEQQLEALNEKYLTIAVIAAAIVGLIFILVLYKSYRLGRKLKRERTAQDNESKERLAISKDIREDLGLELSRINFLSQEVFYKPSGNETKKNVSSIIEISTRLMENTRDLVWQLNTENTTLANLVGRLREHSSEYLQDLPLEVIFRGPESMPNVPLKKMAYRNIFMAVKEALNNIVKHARALNVDISVNLKGDYLNITVKDDGVGYDRSSESLGTGVKIMKTRVQAIGGLLNVIGEEQGTSVRMDIRISQIVKPD
jgi:signal transduction histidine kinase